MKEFLDKAAFQNHPLRLIEEFLDAERSNETAKAYDKIRFVGYVLEIGYDTVTIITSDPFKIVVGGVPRNSLLIMAPSETVAGAPPNFTVLRVLETAPTPLSRDTQQTYFELQKKSMPELDIFTQSELQWGALKTAVLGMFYPHPLEQNKIEFSGDVNNYVSAHKYRVYSPNEKLLNLIINSLVPAVARFDIGDLRLTECRLPLPGQIPVNVPVSVSTSAFMGARTAMFGKTRLGKSNVVKLIAQSLLDTTKQNKNVGQLIFDINGEYANDNPQDGNVSIASAYKDRCVVYALTKKEATESRPLKLDFYEHPQASLPIIASLLRETGKDDADYIKAFLSVDLPSFQQIEEMDPGEQRRAKRKVLIYWAILNKAGFAPDAGKLHDLMSLDPGINQKALKTIYGDGELPKATTLDGAQAVLEAAAKKDREQKLPSSTANKNLFDSDDEALLGFLLPKSTIGSGPRKLQPLRAYHDKSAGNFVVDILDLLENGKTVILDLGNAPPELMQYFSIHLSKAVFRQQVDKFSNNTLGEKYVQLYFEEAHNLFAPSDTDEKTSIYRRLAKEGAKYHIGMVYSTQSVSSVSKDLLGQTENFFIAHLASQEEVGALAKVNIAYDSFRDDIMTTKTPGFIRMLTLHHRFVIPMQAKKFEAAAPISASAKAT